LTKTGRSPFPGLSNGILLVIVSNKLASGYPSLIQSHHHYYFIQGNLFLLIDAGFGTDGLDAFGLDQSLADLFQQPALSARGMGSLTLAGIETAISP